MPKLTRLESDERERFVIEKWKAIWPKGAASTDDLPPASKINDLVKAKFGEFMRSDKVYVLRDMAIDQMRTAGVMVPDPPRKYRKEQLPERPNRNVVAPSRVMAAATVKGSSMDTGALPHMVKGLSPEAAAAVSRVLDELRAARLCGLRVEHSGAGYVLIGEA